jgi:hypothetical protein
MDRIDPSAVPADQPPANISPSLVALPVCQPCLGTGRITEHRKPAGGIGPVHLIERDCSLCEGVGRVGWDLGVGWSR